MQEHAEMLAPERGNVVSVSLTFADSFLTAGDEQDEQRREYGGGKRIRSFFLRRLVGSTG